VIPASRSSPPRSAAAQALFRCVQQVESGEGKGGACPRASVSTSAPAMVLIGRDRVTGTSDQCLRLFGLWDIRMHAAYGAELLDRGDANTLLEPCGKWAVGHVEEARLDHVAGRN
jgi:hypothetical protein